MKDSVLRSLSSRIDIHSKIENAEIFSYINGALDKYNIYLFSI